MRAKPIVALAIIATALVGWFSLRMWCGDQPTIWRLSCLFGAWSPIVGALVFSYISAVGDREHSVVSAWLARAIGMHCVLLWMLGVADIVRGAPGHETGYDADAVAPLLLLSFAPVLAVCIATVRWTMRVGKQLGLSFSYTRPDAPKHTDLRVVPFRGLPMIVVQDESLRVPYSAWALGVLGFVWMLLAPSITLLPVMAIAFAMKVVRNPRAFVASMVSLPLLACAATWKCADMYWLEAQEVGLVMPVIVVFTVLLHLVMTSVLVRWLRGDVLRSMRAVSG